MAGLCNDYFFQQHVYSEQLLKYYFLIRDLFT